MMPGFSRTAVAVPELRIENRSIYAMGHQKTGLAGRPLEPLDHFLVWREQQSRDPVKTCCGTKAPVFNGTQQSGGRGLREELQHRRKATSGVLMHIGLPRSA